MNKQPEALRLAERLQSLDLGRWDVVDAAAELRRLHEVNVELLDALKEMVEQEPVAWRDHVEQRLLTWRQSFVNRSGDQLALNDFMDKQSLDDLLEYVLDEYTYPQPAQPKQEPVAWADMNVRGEDKGLSWTPGHFHTQPLYTTPPTAPVQEPVAWKNAAIRLGEELSSVGPDGYYNMTAEQWLDWAMDQQPRGKNSLSQPQREWQKLTDEEVQYLWGRTTPNDLMTGGFDFARAIEATLKEKNDVAN
jgi:cell wall-associated NlpC family hydrolase